MLRGLIDIGSNTIKAFVYEVENKKCTVKTSTRFYLHLYSYIYNGCISEEGRNALLDALVDCIKFLDENGCFHHVAFATAALRDSENGIEIIEYLQEKCGVSVEIISGETEALCDMLSMKYQSGVEEALGMDIGGGSGQIFLYDRLGLKKSASLPIGALKVADKFVKNLCPTKDEIISINKYITDCLSDFNGIKKEVIYLMGGSATEIKKLFPMVVNFGDINTDNLKMFFETLSQNNDLELFLRDNAPGRERTIMPACVILLTIAEFFEAKEFVVLQNGVREGYLIKNNFFI